MAEMYYSICQRGFHAVTYIFRVVNKNPQGRLFIQPAKASFEPFSFLDLGYSHNDDITSFQERGYKR
jgi:hypothetical protein